jgi:hypothetical protein
VAFTGEGLKYFRKIINLLITRLGISSFFEVFGFFDFFGFFEILNLFWVL